MTRRLTIRTRLTAWYGAVLAATVLALGVTVWVSAGAILRGSVDEALHVQLADVQAGLGRDHEVAVTRLDPAQPGIFTAILARDGTVRLRSPGVPSNLRPAPVAGVQQLVDGGTTFAVLAAATANGETIVVGTSLAAVDRTLGGLALILTVVSIGGFVASLAGGWLLSGRALGPVERLTREATVIGAADLDRRLPEPTRFDEIGRLTQTLNGMLDRVAASVRRERAFVSAASHDLRTPVAALRTELELAARAPEDGPSLRLAVQAAHADAVRLSNLAADLLGLAEAEASGRELLRRPVTVHDLLDATVALVLPLAEERSVVLSVSAPAAIVEIDRVRIEQALVNLLSNAIRESPISGTVEIEAAVRTGDGAPVASSLDARAGADSTGGEAASLEIAVLDRGPGVDPSIRPALFIPFASRARGRPDGTGLGLATAAAAVRAHGGQIGYEDRPGGGSIFRIQVPIAILPSSSAARATSAAEPATIRPRRGELADRGRTAVLTRRAGG
jgi:signal transduction histidine kinase